MVGADTAQCAYTCQLKAGSYQHEAMDAATYCAAGIDYVSQHSPLDLCLFASVLAKSSDLCRHARLGAGENRCVRRAVPSGSEHLMDSIP